MATARFGSNRLAMWAALAIISAPLRKQILSKNVLVGISVSLSALAPVVVNTYIYYNYLNLGYEVEKVYIYSQTCKD